MRRCCPRPASSSTQAAAQPLRLSRRARLVSPWQGSACCVLADAKCVPLLVAARVLLQCSAAAARLKRALCQPGVTRHVRSPSNELALTQATATPAGAPPLNLVQATAGGASLANVALVIDFDTALFLTAGAPAPAPDAAAAAPAPLAGTAVSTANGVRLAGVLNGAVRFCRPPLLLKRV